jgi:hypothetical protein
MQDALQYCACCLLVTPKLNVSDLHFTDRKLPPSSHLVLTSSVCYAVDTSLHYDVRSNQSLTSTSLMLCEMLCNVLNFYGEVSNTSPKPKLEDHLLSAVRGCLFSMLVTTLHIWRPWCQGFTYHGRSLREIGK